MRLALYSEDPSLLRLCRDVTGNLPGASWEVVWCKPEETVAADVCLWDVDLTSGITSQKRDNVIDVFLVPRGSIRSFLQQNPKAGPNTLLKPVSPAAFEVFLTHLVPTLDTQRATSVDSAREDRDVLLDCLFHATLRLQEFEEDRTRFWARAVHDFRAPLTAASGYCDLLLGAQLGELNEVQRDLLTRINQSLGKLTRMASAMFQLTAGRQLEGRYDPKRVDIEGLLRRSMAEVQFFAAEKGITLELEYLPPSHPLYLEETQIEQVLVNLLENACKFTPKQGRIEIRSYPVQWSFPNMLPPRMQPGPDFGRKLYSGYRVDIADSGPGIPPEHLKIIFEEFVSYGSPADRSGGGLGLAICKKVLEAHQGEIWAESSNGTTFSFVLPFNDPVTREPFALSNVARIGEAIEIFSEEPYERTN